MSDKSPKRTERQKGHYTLALFAAVFSIPTVYEGMTTYAGTVTGAAITAIGLVGAIVAIWLVVT